MTTIASDLLSRLIHGVPIAHAKRTFDIIDNYIQTIEPNSIPILKIKKFVALRPTLRKAVEDRVRKMCENFTTAEEFRRLRDLLDEKLQFLCTKLHENQVFNTAESGPIFLTEI